MAHAPKLSFAAIAVMSSVAVIYVGIKSPLKINGLVTIELVQRLI